MSKDKELWLTCQDAQDCIYNSSEAKYWIEKTGKERTVTVSGKALSTLLQELLDCRKRLGYLE